MEPSRCIQEKLPFNHVLPGDPLNHITNLCALRCTSSRRNTEVFTPDGPQPLHFGEAGAELLWAAGRGPTNVVNVEERIA